MCELTSGRETADMLYNQYARFLGERVNCMSAAREFVRLTMPGETFSTNENIAHCLYVTYDWKDPVQKAIRENIRMDERMGRHTP